MADTPITIARARVSPLLDTEKNYGFTHKFTVLAADIAFGSGATDTVTLTIGNTPASWIVTHALINVTTAFAGPGGLTAQVGFGSNTTAAVAATSVLAAGAIGTAGLVPASFANSTGTSTAAIKAVFTSSTSGGPAALTAGKLDIYLNILDLAKAP